MKKITLETAYNTLARITSLGMLAYFGFTLITTFIQMNEMVQEGGSLREIPFSVYVFAFLPVIIYAALFTISVHKYKSTRHATWLGFAPIVTIFLVGTLMFAQTVYQYIAYTMQG